VSLNESGRTSREEARPPQSAYAKLARRATRYRPASTFCVPPSLSFSVGPLQVIGSAGSITIGLEVMQPGRKVEMMPHLPCSTLQQPVSGVPPMPVSTDGQFGSATAGSEHAVSKPIAVLFDAHISLPLTVTQHGITQVFIAKSVGTVQVS